jgi:hypothetical protein
MDFGVLPQRCFSIGPGVEARVVRERAERRAACWEAQVESNGRGVGWLVQGREARWVRCEGAWCRRGGA